MNEDERLVLFGRLEATVDRLLKPGSAERLEILKAVIVGMELAAEVLDKFDAKIGKRPGGGQGAE